jgi:hypothetical protein
MDTAARARAPSADEVKDANDWPSLAEVETESAPGCRAECRASAAPWNWPNKPNATITAFAVDGTLGGPCPAFLSLAYDPDLMTACH